MAAEGGTYLPPVVASLVGDSDALARTLIGAKAMLEDFTRTPTTIDIDARITSLAQLQLDLLKDLTGMQAQAAAIPIDINTEIRSLSSMQTELLKDLGGIQALATTNPIDIDVEISPMANLQAEMLENLNKIKALAVATPIDINARITSLADLQVEILKDLSGIQALATNAPIDVNAKITPLGLLQTEILEDLRRLQALASVNPVDIEARITSLEQLQLSLLKDLNGVRVLAAASPIEIKAKTTPLATLQLELLKDIGGITALAQAHPVEIPLQLDMFQIISDTTLARMAIVDTLNHPQIKADIGPNINMAEFITARAIISTLFAGIGGGIEKKGGIGAIAGGVAGGLGFGKGGGVGGGGWMPQIVPAGLPFLAAFGTIGGLAGFSVEHVLTVILGLLGSLSEAFLGLGVIALGTFATMAVGMGSDMAVMKSTIADTQTLYKAWTGVQQAILLYGKNSSQAQAATQLLNQQMKILGNTAGVQAEMGLAKLAYTINQQWDQATSNARVQAVGLLTQILLLGQAYIPLVANAAQKNLAIITSNLMPLFAWLKGPQGMGIFNDLENKFAKNLPQSIATFNQAIMFLLRFLDLASNYTSGFMSYLNQLFTYLNSGTGFGRVTRDVNIVIGVFKIWRDFIIILSKDLFILLGQTVGVGNSIIVSLTGMLTQLHTWLQSTSGKNAIGSLFAAHKQEILILLQLLPQLVGPVAQIYLKLAVPLTQIATAILNVISYLLRIPGAGPIIAYGAAFYILASRMGLATLAMGLWNGVVKVATGLQVAFDIALSANVIALIIIAIIALVAVIVLLITHWKDVTKVVQQVWKDVTHWVGQIVADVGKFFSNLGTTVEKTWSSFASRPGYWIGYMIGLIGGKMFELDKDFAKWFLSIVGQVVAWGTSMAQSAPGALSSFLSSVMTEMNKLPGQVFSVGASIATGLWEGLKSMQKWLNKQIDDFFGGLVAGAMKAIKSGSPSMVFSEVGKTIPQGVAHGINTNAALSMAALISMFNQMNSVGGRLGVGLSGPGMARVGAGGHGPITLSAPININMPAGSAGNPALIAQVVSKAIDAEFEHLISRLQGGVYSTPGSS